MSFLDILRTIIFPGLYLIGLLIIYFHQKSKIDNLQGDFDRAIELLKVIDPDKMKTYAEMQAEMVRFDFEKKEFENDRTDLLKTLKEHNEQLRHIKMQQTEIDKLERKAYEERLGLIADLSYPLAETEFLEWIISRVPEGQVKSEAESIRKILKERNREKGIINPLADLFNYEAARVSSQSEEKKGISK